MSNANRVATEARIKDSANELLKDSKKLANDLYEDSKDKVNQKMSEAEEFVQEYSETLVKKIHANPLTSVLVAAGIGYLLSSIFRK